MAQYSDYGWWGGEASAPRGLGGMTNQYAAMPSLHCGWALWCGVMLWMYGGTRLTKIAGVLYPLITTIVVMGTANHYFLDAVAGFVVMGAGFLVTRPLLRLADTLRARYGIRPLAPSLGGPAAVPHGSGSSIVSVECQTSPGERLPRQRKVPATPGAAEPGAEPAASPVDAGDETPAAAR
jgi:PAP2 superfamily